ARENAAQLFSYAAGGFRDFTRIASSHPEMWRDICIANRDRLLEEIDRYSKNLGSMRKIVGAADSAALEKLFAEARAARHRRLDAALVMTGGEYRLAGAPRMHERPSGDLVNALRGIGADVEYLGADGYPPLALHPAAIKLNEPVTVKGDVSSQFLTALLMALPLLDSKSRVEVRGELISRPYVEITLNVMRRFGVEVARREWHSFEVP